MNISELCSPYSFIKASYLVYIVGSLLYFHVSCNYISSIFYLPGLAVTLNVNRLSCGMKISHLRVNQLLVTKEIFPVNHASCEKEWY